MGIKVNNNRQEQRLYWLWLPEERQAARKRLESSGHDSMTERERISAKLSGTCYACFTFPLSILPKLKYTHSLITLLNRSEDDGRANPFLEFKMSDKLNRSCIVPAVCIHISRKMKANLNRAESAGLIIVQWPQARKWRQKVAAKAPTAVATSTETGKDTNIIFCTKTSPVAKSLLERVRKFRAVRSLPKC